MKIRVHIAGEGLPSFIEIDNVAKFEVIDGILALKTTMSDTVAMFAAGRWQYWRSIDGDENGQT